MTASFRDHGIAITAEAQPRYATARLHDHEPNLDHGNKTAAPAEVTGAGVTGAGVTGAGVTGAGVTGAGVTGAGVTGAGVTGAGVTGAGVTGAGVTGAGVTGAGVTGAGIRLTERIVQGREPRQHLIETGQLQNPQDLRRRAD